MSSLEFVKFLGFGLPATRSLSCKFSQGRTFGFFFFRTNSWNLEPCLGIELKCSEVRATVSGLELLDRKFNRN